MRKILIVFSLLLPILAEAQTYDSQLQEAVSLFRKKEFKQSFELFSKVLNADTTVSGPFDLYAGAKAAANSGNAEQAFNWLHMGTRKGLGLKNGELAYLEKDSTLILLHTDSRWTTYIQTIKTTIEAKEKSAKERKDNWAKEIDGNAALAKEGKIQPGFARYYSKADSVEVPYLVYVPKSYQPGVSSGLIIYLHGAVVSIDNFNDADPDLCKPEPIFAMADSLNAIVLYPFGKKTFGWSKQEAAFSNILKMYSYVRKAYNTDRRHTTMVGMSNGGTALFWFATQQGTPFKKYLAISAFPALKIGDINFTMITSDKKFITLNAEDDSVFPIGAVRKIYDENRDMAAGWKLLTIEKGEHAFLYSEKGSSVILEYLRSLNK